MKSNACKYGSYPLFSVLALGLALGSAQAAQEMVVVGYGGAGQKAQDTAFFKPFSARDGSQLMQSEYNGEMARIKVMVDTGSVDWDVVQIEDRTWPVVATRACTNAWTGNSSAMPTN